MAELMAISLTTTITHASPPTKLDTYTIFKGYFGAHVFRKWRTPKSSARIGMPKRGEIAFLLLCIPRNLVVSLSSS